VGLALLSFSSFLSLSAESRPEPKKIVNKKKVQQAQSQPAALDSDDAGYGGNGTSSQRQQRNAAQLTAREQLQLPLSPSPPRPGQERPARVADMLSLSFVKSRTLAASHATSRLSIDGFTARNPPTPLDVSPGGPCGRSAGRSFREATSHDCGRSGSTIFRVRALGWHMFPLASQSNSHLTT
jgi:hypothetical protein